MTKKDFCKEKIGSCSHRPIILKHFLKKGNLIGCAGCCWCCTENCKCKYVCEKLKNSKDFLYPKKLYE